MRRNTDAVLSVNCLWRCALSKHIFFLFFLFLKIHSLLKIRLDMPFYIILFILLYFSTAWWYIKKNNTVTSIIFSLLHFILTRAFLSPSPWHTMYCLFRSNLIALSLTLWCCDRKYYLEIQFSICFFVPPTVHLRSQRNLTKCYSWAWITKGSSHAEREGKNKILFLFGHFLSVILDCWPQIWMLHMDDDRRFIYKNH